MMVQIRIELLRCVYTCLTQLYDGRDIYRIYYGVYILVQLSCMMVEIYIEFITVCIYLSNTNVRWLRYV